MHLQYDGFIVVKSMHPKCKHKSPQLLPGGGNLVSKDSFLYLEGSCPGGFIDV